MAKQTLLEMTQNILAAMDSDDVNDISATVESGQVAEFIKESYFRLVSDKDYPFLRTMTALNGAADVALPTKMTMPETLNKVFWVRYNKKPVTYLDPLAFKDMLDKRTVLAGVVDNNGYVLNADPTYWTTYDDSVVWFDGLDTAVETTLQTSKSAVYGIVAPAWTHTNSFVPTLPEKFFPTLLAEAKATCFMNIKQQGNAREEKNSQRGRNRMQNEAWRANDGEAKSNVNINYGRRGGNVTYSRKNKFAVYEN